MTNQSYQFLCFPTIPVALFQFFFLVCSSTFLFLFVSVTESQMRKRAIPTFHLEWKKVCMLEIMLSQVLFYVGFQVNVN